MKRVVASMPHGLLRVGPVSRDARPSRPRVGYAGRAIRPACFRSIIVANPDLNRRGDEEPDVKDDAPSEDESASTEIRYRISSYGADYPVDSLVKRLQRGDIAVPQFQREFVWPLPQASRFIESLLLGLPVPAIFLSKDSETQRLVVIDGQQRLKSLLYFYEGVLLGKEFKLQGVTKEFEDLTYRSLEDEDRRRLDDSILHAIIIKQEDPGDDDSSVYMVFERLNTTSTALSSQEIRACVYHGSFNDYLARANENRHWRAIFGKPSARQKDRELLLRFFALFYRLDSYKRPMKLFLNDFMNENRHLKRYGEATLNSVLEPTMAIVNETVGREAFRPQYALNASVTDAILVGVARRLQSSPVTDRGAFKTSLEAVLHDERFAELYTVGTTDPVKVRDRIEKVTSALRFVD